MKKEFKTKNFNKFNQNDGLFHSQILVSKSYIIKKKYLWYNNLN